jgi:hypothetical protein
VSRSRRTCAPNAPKATLIRANRDPKNKNVRGMSRSLTDELKSPDKLAR